MRKISLGLALLTLAALLISCATEKPEVIITMAQPLPQLTNAVAPAPAPVAPPPTAAAVALPVVNTASTLAAAPQLGATPFPAYDRALVEAIEKNWQKKLLTLDATAKEVVVVEFKLHADGHISEARVVQEAPLSRHAEACLKVIEETAPFARWSVEMRLAIGSATRDIRFTFNLDPKLKATATETR